MTEKGKNTNSLGEVIAQIIDKYHLRDKMYEGAVRNAWENAMGKAIANRTTGVQLRKTTLIVTLNSSPLRQELTYNLEAIRKKINTELGTDYISEIILR